VKTEIRWYPGGDHVLEPSLEHLHDCMFNHTEWLELNVTSKYRKD